MNLQVFEVFGQEKSGEPHVHVGSVLAGDVDMAYLLAKEAFTRRGEFRSLWVAPRKAMRKTSAADAPMLKTYTDRSYRLGIGYRKTVEKWRRLQEGRQG
ncbi:MAG: phenylacetic acid degradation protein PaaB [Bacillota bacterium]|nr:phenylacetic acid degradation protein PaaB [Bacillota bacterium]